MKQQIQTYLDKLLTFKPGIKLDLGRMHDALAASGSPQHNMPPTVHVAGTNGKGSTLAFLTAICEEAGLTVHRYTSPHLVAFNERIYLAGKPLSDAQLLAILERIMPFAEAHHLTFFEATTLAAFLLFSEHPADIVLLETGLGGRLDATNMIEHPALTCITPIGMDHQDFLGNNLTAIAGEKAGIMKAGRPCVIAYQSKEALSALTMHAAQKQAPTISAETDWFVSVHDTSFQMNDWQLPLPTLMGPHQPYNAGTAIACAEALADQGLLTLSQPLLEHAMQKAHIPARMQPITSIPLPSNIQLWLDGGHNPMAGSMLAQHMQQHWKDARICLIVAMKEDKEYHAFLEPMLPFCSHIIHVDIASEGIAPIPYASMQPLFESMHISSESIPPAQGDIGTAIQHAIHQKADYILVTGSLYLAGKLLSYAETYDDAQVG